MSVKDSEDKVMSACDGSCGDMQPTRLAGRKQRAFKVKNPKVFVMADSSPQQNTLLPKLMKRIVTSRCFCTIVVSHDITMLWKCKSSGLLGLAAAFGCTLFSENECTFALQDWILTLLIQWVNQEGAARSPVPDLMKPEMGV
ncbi:hypothetical protein F2P81_016731 [Scophthalmus maximus]|uniref:Uncharacterized protein n=1 Tax=Scophthalmus maximus TaxID=52904 RepID=A0A6A4SDX7_SCOMX|nr:hypothetical protein F2P81_016731 [Scophthalmus maximus]